MTRLVTGVADAQQRGSSKHNWGLLREFAASGISVGVANTVLNPVGEYLAASWSRSLCLEGTLARNGAPRLPSHVLTIQGMQQKQHVGQPFTMHSLLQLLVMHVSSNWHTYQALSTM